MNHYQAAIVKHLGEYAKRRLGVFEEGIYKGRSYAHILPFRLRYLNFLESFRAELQDYCAEHKSLRLHRYFHHLNSSQAFALNLFFPYLSSPSDSARALSAALGVDAKVLTWEFEYVADRSEGTSVDVVWRLSDTAAVFCEVKLSEAGFGATKEDEKHLEKLARIYRGKLESLVLPGLLQERTFFGNYQIMRNICLLADSPEHQLIFLLPRENARLGPSLDRVLGSVRPETRRRIKIAYIEDCLHALCENPALSPRLRLHAANLGEKYIVAS